MFKKQNSSTSSASITPKDTSSIAKVLDKLKGHNLNNGSVKFNPGENGLVFKYVTNLFMATVKRDSISFLINPMSGSILNIVDAKVRMEIAEFITRSNAGDPNPELNLDSLPVYAPYLLDENVEVKPMFLTESKEDYVTRKLEEWTAEWENRLYWETYDAGLARSKHLAHTTGPVAGRAAAVAQVIADDAVQVHDPRYHRVAGDNSTLSFMGSVPGLPVNLTYLNEEMFNSRVNAVAASYDKNKNEAQSKKKKLEDEWDEMHEDVVSFEETYNKACTDVTKIFQKYYSSSIYNTYAEALNQKRFRHVMRELNIAYGPDMGDTAVVTEFNLIIRSLKFNTNQCTLQEFMEIFTTVVNVMNSNGSVIVGEEMKLEYLKDAINGGKHGGLGSVYEETRTVVRRAGGAHAVFNYERYVEELYNVWKDIEAKQKKRELEEQSKLSLIKKPKVDTVNATDNAYSSNNYTVKNQKGGNSSGKGGGGNFGDQNKPKVNSGTSGEKKKFQNPNGKYPCEYCGKYTHLSSHCVQIKCQVCGQTGKCWPNKCRESEQNKINATANESDSDNVDDEVDEDSNAKLADTFKIKTPKPTQNSSSNYRKVKFANGH